MEQDVTIRTPGKLMVAGEFAVLERGYPLIVMAINKYVETTVQRSEENCVTLTDFDLHNIRWNCENGFVQFERDDERLSFLRDALQTVITYLMEQKIPITTFSVTIKSELDDHQSGLKYGLGSSAAVVASVIYALMKKFAPDKMTNKLLFKLAAISHIKTQGNGSGADIAASIYGGVLAYTSFQAEWLLEKLTQTEQLSVLVEANWKYLSIERVQFPEKLHLCIGWTGSPAKTKNLVNDILTLRKTNHAAYSSFLQKSELAVNQLLQAMKSNDSDLFLKGIKLNRNTLSTLGKVAKVELETAKLAYISDTAEKLFGAGKFSGAGGGDCGIAFLKRKTHCDEIYSQWRKARILPLELAVCSEGSHQVNDV